MRRAGRAVAVVVALAAAAGCAPPWPPGDSGFQPAAELRMPGLTAHLPAGKPGSGGPARGTNAWRLTRPAKFQIGGYATRVAVAPGEPVTLRVSTTAARFRVEAYRFGWYRGGQARLVWRSGPHAGRQQPPGTLVGGSARTIVARWRDSLTVPTAGWPPGAYLLKLVASSGWQSYVPLFVDSPTAAGRVALVAPVLTWQAYNDWAGFSLYNAPPGRLRSRAVSFDRPYGGLGGGRGAADMLYGVRPVVIEAERLGLPLAYLTDLDLEARPNALAGARAYVSMGHDEYWTPAMRRAVLSARAHATNLAFLGADTAFWRVRLAASPTGPRRVVIGYRWDYPADPETAAGAVTATAPFGTAPHAAPPEALTGTRYDCYPADAPYTVISPGWWGFAGTGVRAGQRFAHLVGIEADRVHPGGSTPRPLQVLSSTDYSCRGVPTSAQSVYYTTPEGAGVFTAGTLRWTCAIEDVCGAHPVSAATARFTRRVTDNVLRAFAAGPAGPAHPARDNLDHLSLPAGHAQPAN